MIIAAVINTLIGHGLDIIELWEFVLCCLIVAGIESKADVWIGRALFSRR